MTIWHQAGGYRRRVQHRVATVDACLRSSVTERDPRRETEEAARTGRFPDDDGALRDDSAPVEREVPPEEVDGETMRPNEAYPPPDDLPGS
jgi:hypothetical protein